VIRNLARLGIAIIAGGVLVAGWVAYRIDDVGKRDDRQSVDAIVVLGAAQYNGRPSAILKARLDHAIALYDAGYAPYLVVTGGKAEGDRTTEAAAARAYALANGVPAAAILAEDQGRTTPESLHGVAALLRTNGLRSTLFVSDRTHMLRVLRIAQDEGMTPYSSPTTTSPTDSSDDPLGRLEATIHELGGLALYFVVGQTLS
jgi:uncharacterized SAM-binding protein YcdF (DUF218 family)